MERSEVMSRIKELLIKTKIINSENEITESTNLETDYNIDSMKTTNLLVQLENEFDIEIDIERIEFETITIISKLADFILDSV